MPWRTAWWAEPGRAVETAWCSLFRNLVFLELWCCKMHVNAVKCHQVPAWGGLEGKEVYTFDGPVDGVIPSTYQKTRPPRINKNSGAYF